MYQKSPDEFNRRYGAGNGLVCFAVLVFKLKFLGQLRP